MKYACADMKSITRQSWRRPAATCAGEKKCGGIASIGLTATMRPFAHSKHRRYVVASRNLAAVIWRSVLITAVAATYRPDARDEHRAWMLGRVRWGNHAICLPSRQPLLCAVVRPVGGLSASPRRMRRHFELPEQRVTHFS